MRQGNISHCFWFNRHIYLIFLTRNQSRPSGHITVCHFSSYYLELLFKTSEQNWYIVTNATRQQLTKYLRPTQVFM